MQIGRGLVLQRLKHDDKATQGELYLDGALICRTLENRPPVVPGVKEPGESRIPAGRYPLRLRTEGGFFTRYTRKWAWHGAMAEIVIPGWQYVLFHIGNYHKDTAGCILVGESHGQSDQYGLAVWRSTAAYRRVYSALMGFGESRDILSVRDEL